MTQRVYLHSGHFHTVHNLFNCSPPFHYLLFMPIQQFCTVSRCQEGLAPIPTCTRQEAKRALQLQAFEQFYNQLKPTIQKPCELTTWREEQRDAMIIGALSQAFLKRCRPLRATMYAHACGKNYFCIEDKGLIKTSLFHQRGPTKDSGYPLYKRSWPPLGLKMPSLPSTVCLYEQFPNICWEQPEATLLLEIF